MHVVQPLKSYILKIKPFSVLYIIAETSEIKVKPCRIRQYRTKNIYNTFTELDASHVLWYVCQTLTMVAKK